MMPAFEDYMEADSVYIFVDMVTKEYESYYNVTLGDLTPVYSGNEVYEGYDYSSDYGGYSGSVGSGDLDAFFNVILTVFIIAVVATGIAAGTVWSAYHKHAKISAVAYLKQDSVNIYNRSDRFVREYTTRTPRSNGSSGGGGGGGRSFHSGGGHHGGGSGRGRR
jgi:uncharacterized membrane protein YgcG